MPVLLKILGIKAIGTMVSIVFLATRSAPGFITPEITIVNESLHVETILKKAFSKGLDEIIKSGTEVGIFYTIELLEKDEHGLARMLFEKTLGQYVSFETGADQFKIGLIDGSETAVDNLDSAKILITNIDINVIAIDRIKQECAYQIRLSAALNTIELEAIDAKHFDLNAFWNFKYPMKNTRWFFGRDIKP